MTFLTRREFFRRTAIPGAISAITPAFLRAGSSGAELLHALGGSFQAEYREPHIVFPKAPRDRVSVSSYPFREFIQGKHDSTVAGTAGKMAIKDFAAHVRDKFQIHRIEPWSEHFLSLEHGYLDEIRGGVQKAGSSIVNIAVDGEDSPYAADRAERDRAVTFSKRWIDAAVRIGSPSVRTNIPPASDSKPDVHRLAESLSHVADYGAEKNIVVHLENDNPVSEDPFFLAQVIDEVNSPWLHALPDFGNSLAALSPEQAYRGIAAMFYRAYGISHVKDSTTTREGKVVEVDVARTFSIAAQNNYAGFFSMEFEGQGDPYAGTAHLIELTIQNLSSEKKAADG
jgi:sugar phosphate isomerase/epimerase